MHMQIPNQMQASLGRGSKICWSDCHANEPPKRGTQARKKEAASSDKAAHLEIDCVLGLVIVAPTLSLVRDRKHIDVP